MVFSFKNVQFVRESH